MAKTLLNIALIVGIIALIGLMISIIWSILDPNMRADGLMFVWGICAVIGAGGSVFSLLMSKWLCKKAYDIEMITTPSNETEAALQNIVADLAARAKIKMPELGIYEADEVNAFATGPSKDQAMVAVSTGLLSNMTPAQIRAVLGHEVWHIKSGDMVTSTMLAGVLNAIVFFFSFWLAAIASMLCGLARLFLSNSRPSGILETFSNGLLSTWGFMVAMKYSRIVMGFFANFINLGFSRYREYKADAGSAQLLGESTDMISALQALQTVNQQHPVQESSMSNFCINGADFVVELLSTHPPLAKRIAALQMKAGIAPAPQTQALPTSPQAVATPQNAPMPQPGSMPQAGQYQQGTPMPQPGQFPQGAPMPQPGQFPQGAPMPQLGQFPQGAPMPQPGQYPQGAPYPQAGQPMGGSQQYAQAPNAGMNMGTVAAAAATAAVASELMTGNAQAAQVPPAAAAPVPPVQPQAAPVPDHGAAAATQAPAEDHSLSQAISSIAKEAFSSDEANSDVPAELRMIDTMAKIDQALAPDQAPEEMSDLITPEEASAELAAMDDSSAQETVDYVEGAVDFEEEAEDSVEEADNSEEEDAEDSDEEEGGFFSSLFSSDDDDE
ncbi:MAG: protease HtpX [Anaerobiospirillum sp.]|nr:protease HtpX [Anaerobiospirillum sp.]